MNWMMIKSGRRARRAAALVGLLILLGITPGCGESFEMEVAPVKGTCTCNGNLVTEGHVLFTPVVPDGANKMNSGKSAGAYINSDGIYELTTYDKNDGAIVGEHEVRLYKPDPEDDEQADLENPYACGNQTMHVTVKPGDNFIDIDFMDESQ